MLQKGSNIMPAKPSPYPHVLHIANPFVTNNHFLTASPTPIDLPKFDDVRTLIPQPYWNNHERAIDMYWYVWELAFQNLANPTLENGFIAPYIDTAFNDCIFLWDSAMILMFTRYANEAFNFLGTLDNFYSKQHPDGFICREISFVDGSDQFYRSDPASTGPNILAWVEWEYFLQNGNKQRLHTVFAPLVAYHQWLRQNRTWRDGTYWTCGWASGMDNLPRVPGGADAHRIGHGHNIWADMNFQQMLSARLLMKMADVLGKQDDISDIAEEYDRLSQQVNQRLWNPATNFYLDLRADGSHSDVKTVGAYWALLAGNTIPNIDAFIAHLENTRTFNRPHRVPALSADHLAYHRDGQYWLGGVWAPTNYMVLRGLTEHGYDALAHAIARNHHDNVLQVYQATNTLWENYSPELAKPGDPAKSDFVGWTGLPATAILLEYIFGLRLQAQERMLLWDVRLTEAHGVKHYRFGQGGMLDLHCAQRTNTDVEPEIQTHSNQSITLVVRWQGGEKTISLP
jgi:hypothetical protein